MKFLRHISFLLMLLALILTACRDEMLYYQDTVIGEGEADINFKLEFHPLEPALDTRSPGNAVDKINELWVVIYNISPDGSEAGLYEKIRLYDSETNYTLPGSNFNIDQTGNIQNPGDAETFTPSDNQNVGSADGTISGSGEKTPSASFILNHIPYGRYKIFAVANVDLSDVDCTTIDKLRSKRFDWQTDVSLDNQMFGYFTPSENQNSAGFDAPVLIINKNTVLLHSWIKRLVSKVTVSFDASELKENVRVYIKSITIHDIPASCALGEVNTPTDDNQLIKTGESFTYYDAGEGSDANHEKWKIVLSKGAPYGGQTGHTETDPSLYFYENMQGDYPGVASMDKRQDPAAVGTPIDNPGEPDYKDARDYGTYIEVVAYYDSRNKDKISQGPIRYRFMLGKNSTYNYNAERNFHYKLTLKLRGWANEADWHISYKEYTPTLITPEPYYISYLYNQKMEFPARVILPEEWDKTKFYIKAEIVENNWWPWDRALNDSAGGRPDEFVGLQTDENGFAWNTASLNVYPPTPYKKSTYNGDPYQGGNYVGFLSLRPNTADIIGTDAEVEAQTGGLDSNGYGEHANEYLEWYYKTNNLAVNEYNLTGSGATYDEIDKSIRLKIPMYTRNKEMVPATDFTGNNPFNSYYRYAKVRFTLWQRTSTGDQSITFKNEEGEWETERVATIYQVPRIENPKAIYRDAGNDAEFLIKLMIMPQADATEFTTFKSDGPWKAYVDCQTENFIELYDQKGNKVDTVRGVTDEDIVFKYKPKSTINDNQTRSGIIKVEYHDYNCTHLIFVRQGYHKGVKLGDATWSCYNVYATSNTAYKNGNPPDRNSLAPSDETNVPVALTKSPLSVGSLLKRCQYNYSIREKNIANGYGWLISVTNAQLLTAHINADNTIDDERTALWRNIQGYGWANYGASQERYSKHWADTWTAVGGFRDNEKFSVPTAGDYQSMLANCKFGYGIVYADGATTTQSNFFKASGFTDHDNDGNDDLDPSRGIRACIAYNENNGANIIFPLGALGQARRTCTEPYGDASAPFTQPGWGSLTYGGLRGVLTSAANRNRPLTFNNYRNTGSIYWIYQPVTKRGSTTTILGDNWPDYASWDINYQNLVFNPFDYNSLGGWSDRTHNYVVIDYDNTSVRAGPSSDALPMKLIYQ